MSASLEQSSQIQPSWWEGLESYWREPAWFALYTRSRHEQVVKTQLDRKEIENYLPMYIRQSQWKDRMKQIPFPLFPGYLFVRIPLLERMEVLKVQGAVQLIGDGKHPLPVPDDQILNLKSCVEGGLKFDPWPYLTVGNRVRVKDGPFAGLEGILLRKKGSSRLVISIDLIQRSLAIEIEGWRIEPA